MDDWFDLPQPKATTQKDWFDLTADQKEPPKVSPFPDMPLPKSVFGMAASNQQLQDQSQQAQVDQMATDKWRGPIPKRPLLQGEPIGLPGTAEQRQAIDTHSKDWYEKLTDTGTVGEKYGLDVARKTLPLQIADRVYRKRWEDARIRLLQGDATDRDLEILGEDLARKRLAAEEAQKTGFLPTLKRAADVATGLPLMAAEFGLAGAGGKAMGAAGTLGEIAGTAGTLTAAQAGTAAAFGQADPKEIASQAIDNTLFSALGPLLPTEGKNVIVRALKGTGKGIGAIEGSQEAKKLLGIQEQGSSIPAALGGDPQAIKELAAQALGFGTFELALNGMARLRERRAELVKEGVKDDSPKMAEELTKAAEELKSKESIPQEPSLDQGKAESPPAATGEVSTHDLMIEIGKDIIETLANPDKYNYDLADWNNRKEELGKRLGMDPNDAVVKAMQEYRKVRGKTPPPEAQTPSEVPPTPHEVPPEPTNRRAEEFAKQVQELESKLGRQATDPELMALANPANRPPSPPEPPKAESTAATPERDSASVRNAATDVYRQELGMGERPAVPTEPREAVLERAKQITGTTAEKIADEVIQKPRSITREEQAVLAADKVRIEREYQATKAEADRLRAAGDTVNADILTEAANKHLDQAKKFVEASELGGSETARDLAFRQWFIKEDFSPGRMLFDLERSGPAPDKSKARIVELSDQLQKAHDRIVELENAPAPEIPPRRNRKATTGKELEKAWDEFKRVTSGKLFSNPIDPEVIKAGAILVKAAVKDGIARVQDFIESVAQRHGQPLTDDQRAGLEQIWAEHYKSPEAKRSETTAKATNKRADALEERIANQDFEPKKRTPVVETPELIEARTRYRKLQEEAKAMKRQNDLAHQTPIQKSLRIVREVANGIPRTLMASVDAFLGRQGWFQLAAHPARTLQGMGEHWAAFFSQAAADKATSRVENRPNYQSGIYKRAGLDLTHTHAEEGFFSHFFDHLDSLPKVGKYIKHVNFPEMSERSFRVGANRMRADAFDFLVGNLQAKNGSVSDVEAKVIANFVNNATGRLSHSTLKDALTKLNDVMFAPQFSASRVALATGRPLRWKLSEKGFGMKETGAARKAIAMEYARAATSLAAVVGMVKLAAWAMDDKSVDVSLDRSSPDLFQIRIGDTRIDLTGGLKQYWVMGSRMADWLQNPKKARSPGDLAVQSARQKLSPSLSLGSELVTGKDAVGNKMTPAEAFQNKLVPLYAKDVKDAFANLDVPQAVAVAFLGLHGFGINTYQSKPKKR